MAKERKIVKRWKSVSDFTKAGVNLTDEQKNFIENQGIRFWVGGDTAEDALKNLKYKVEHQEEIAKKAEKRKQKAAEKRKQNEVARIYEIKRRQNESKIKETLKSIVQEIKEVMTEHGESWQYISRLIVELLNEETNNKIKEAEKQLEELKLNLIK